MMAELELGAILYVLLCIGFILERIANAVDGTGEKAGWLSAAGKRAACWWNG